MELLGAGLLAVALAAVVFGRSVTVKLGSLQASVQGIDKAVNGRPSGDPTLYEQVADCKTQLCEINGKVDGHLAWHQQVSEGG